MERIPILDLQSEVAEIWDELMPKVEEVIKSGGFILGPTVSNFEKAAADYLGVKHAIGCNSGTDALVIGLRALGVKPGDEVICPSFTFFATSESVNNVGATPVFVDIEPESFNIDPAKIEAKITDKTVAILPVHLFGHPANMDEINEIAKKHNLKVIEDCAQSFGSEYKGKKTGSLGNVGAFSFFPTKNLGAYGDGGLITTNCDERADLIKVLRVHGGKDKYKNEMLGYNSRLDALQAAILHVKLGHIDDYNGRRRAIAERYQKLFADVKGVIAPPELDWAKHVFHQYTIRVLDGKRDLVNQKLGEMNISSMIYYPIPVHRLPVYENMEGITLPGDDEMMVTNKAADEVLSIPVYPQLTEDMQKRVVDSIAQIISA